MDRATVWPVCTQDHSGDDSEQPDASDPSNLIDPDRDYDEGRLLGKL